MIRHRRCARLLFQWGLSTAGLLIGMGGLEELTKEGKGSERLRRGRCRDVRLRNAFNREEGGAEDEVLLQFSNWLDQMGGGGGSELGSEEGAKKISSSPYPV